MPGVLVAISTTSTARVDIGRRREGRLVVASTWPTPRSSDQLSHNVSICLDTSRIEPGSEMDMISRCFSRSIEFCGILIE